MAKTSHRPGPLKQQNKGHKTGRHRSKGKIDVELKGRVSAKVISKKWKRELSKAGRRNKALQLRKKKREDLLNQKRIGTQEAPPNLVMVLPLHGTIDVDRILGCLRAADSDAVEYPSNNSNLLHICLPRFKRRFTIVVPSTNLSAILDTAKAADSLLCLVDPNECWDEFGDLCLSCLFAQALPSVTFAAQGMSDVPIKKRHEAKKTLQKQIERRFPNGKLYTVDTEQESILLLRHLAEQKLNTIKWRDLRPHILADDVTFEPNNNENGKGTLKVTGFLRGSCLSVNGLIHLPGFGDFQMNRIEAPSDPCPLNPRNIRRNVKKTEDGMAIDDDENETMEEGSKLLEVVDPHSQESLQSEAVPDPMEGEQTWPTEEELAEAEAALREEKEERIVKRVPKGTSEYQATWIIESEGEDEEEDDDEESDEDEEYVDAMLPEAEDVESIPEEPSEADDMEFETVSISGGSKENYDVHFDEEEEKKLLEKYREERSHAMFPDEIDTPMHMSARTRFARYRGLKSFRTSPWDPKENLPLDYARIFQFESFDRTKKRVLSTRNEGIAEVGNYITIHIADVPRSAYDDYDPSHPLVVFGLLQHEQKMSVLHFTLKRHPDFNEPIKSKERLVFQVGYRRFSACPIFSQHTSGNKHKYERFFPKDSVTVASVFAPITFPPATVLAFKELPDGSHQLVATGTMLGVNPDRIVVKRVVLSGHPFKIINRQAVVRYMFFTREDILWFKPVELRTKWGRRGHIKEPLGTHGHMKCIFDGKMKSQDCIMMNLYKRMYPKWTYDAVGVRSLHITASSQHIPDDMESL
ncbi:pre-rRNA-processing protein TSR1 homolog [Lytechinus variegatus]|uniref:pre-rRNA-processing protein TSR1 homolog n=1 Tax=Lytechinus variegatus TaxID=7654 RepID=UPI001BB26072|nr:pre-rRNA-processing protein TSR1 homolog [Lytechinus variegatus]